MYENRYRIESRRTIRFTPLIDICIYSIYIYTQKKIVIYSTKSGYLARNQRGATFGAVYCKHQILVLQWFFTGSLATLPYTESVKLLYGSSAVLQLLFGLSACYAPLKVLYEPKNHCWCFLAPFLLKKYSATVSHRSEHTPNIFVNILLYLLMWYIYIFYFMLRRKKSHIGLKLHAVSR